MATSSNASDSQYIRYLEQQLADVELKLVDAQKGGQDELSDLHQLLASREEVIQTQQSELRELRAGLAPTRLAEIQKLRKEISQLRHQLESCNKALERQKAEAAQSSSVSSAALAAARSELTSQQAQTSAHARKLQQAEASMRVAASRLQELQQQNSDLEDECSRLASALSRCVSSLERLREHSQASDAAAEGRQAAVHAQERRMQGLRQELDERQAQESQLQATIAEQEQRLAALKAQLFDEQEQHRANTEAIANVRTLESRLATSEQAVQDRNKQIEELKAALSESSSQAQARERELELQVSELESMLHETARSGATSTSAAGELSGASQPPKLSEPMADLLAATVQLSAAVIEARNPSARVQRPRFHPGESLAAEQVDAARRLVQQGMDTVLQAQEAGQEDVAGDCATQ